MKKIKFRMSCGFAGTERSDVFEFEDDTSEKEIEECLQEWAWSYIDCRRDEQNLPNEERVRVRGGGGERAGRKKGAQNQARQQSRAKQGL